MAKEVLPTVVCRCVRSRNLVNEEDLAHKGAVAPKEKIKCTVFKQKEKIVKLNKGRGKIVSAQATKA